MSNMYELDSASINEDRPRFRSIRIFIKGLITQSTILQFLYANYARIRSSHLLKKKSYYAGMRILLHSIKHIEHKKYAEKNRQLFQRQLRLLCWDEGNLKAIEGNKILKTAVQQPDAIEARRIYNSFPEADSVRMRIPGNAEDIERQGNLIVLKKRRDQEKGVILIKYNTAIRKFPLLFDMKKIARDYVLVLEPSWWGYQHERFLLYVGANFNVHVQSQFKADYDFIESLDSNLKPINIGPSDWTNPDLFSNEAGEKKFDIVMNAAWSPFKRHELLFYHLEKLRTEQDISVSVALIGYPWDWQVKTIHNLIERYKLKDTVTIFERISMKDVVDVINASKVSVFLSKTEGSPKALYESLFCNTPVIVYKHNKGIDLEKITEETGMLCEDADLSECIKYMMNNYSRFSPRQWAMENTGCINTSSRLNAAIKESELKAGNAWTEDIEIKMNQPHLRYFESGRQDKYAEEYLKLKNCMRNINQ